MCFGSKKRCVVSESRYFLLELGFDVLRPISKLSISQISPGVQENRIK